MIYYTVHHYKQRKGIAMEIQFYDILKNFNMNIEPSAYGNGHINDTYIVHSQPNYILQRINKNVFTNPPAVMENIMGVTEFLRKKSLIIKSIIKK